MRDDVRLLMHVSKCAGTSLKLTLQISRGVPLLEHYEAHGDQAPADPPPNSVFFGGFKWGLHEKIGCRPRYGIVLRDPIERAWSLYEHVRRLVERHHLQRAAPYLSDALWRGVAAGHSLAKVGETSFFELTNRLTAMLAGRRPRSLDDEETLALAIEHVEQVEWLSIFPEIRVDALAAFIGAELAPLQRINVGDGRPMPKADREAMVALNGLDLRLFEHAKRRKSGVS